MSRDLHRPLPYVVRVRMAATEDTAPAVKEFHLSAYSVMEAMNQAFMMALDTTGLGETPALAVEHIGPDLEAYRLGGY